jgi:hypothetical protein
MNNLPWWIVYARTNLQGVKAIWQRLVYDSILFYGKRLWAFGGGCRLQSRACQNNKVRDAGRFYAFYTAGGTIFDHTWTHHMTDSLLSRNPRAPLCDFCVARKGWNQIHRNSFSYCRLSCALGILLTGPGACQGADLPAWLVKDLQTYPQYEH